jgi:hypothetical protein
MHRNALGEAVLAFQHPATVETILAERTRGHQGPRCA